MLVIGIDVAILMVLCVVFTIISVVVAVMTGMSQDQGDILVCSVFMTSFAYVIAYIVMAGMLDRLV